MNVPKHDVIQDKRGWVEYLRFITPILVTIALFFMASIKNDISSIKNDIKDVDAKMFKHLTNEELHINRDSVVNKETFALYQIMRDKQMYDMREGLNTRIDALKTSMDRVIALSDKK